MNVTKVIGKAVGIQHQGVVDRSIGTADRGVGVPLVVGHFKRGRIDVPMKITLKNIKSVLGYDPDNKDYRTVQSYLDGGFDYVNVLRTINAQVVSEPEPQLPYPPYLKFMLEVSDSSDDIITIEVNTDGDVQQQSMSFPDFTRQFFDKTLTIGSVSCYYYGCHAIFTFTNNNLEKNSKVKFIISNINDGKMKYYSGNYPVLGLSETGLGGVQAVKEFNSSFDYSYSIEDRIMTMSFELGVSTSQPQ